jgi:hypothetical protein
MVGYQEEKGQGQEGKGPPSIPRKSQGFIVAEEDEGEFVVLEPVSLFKVLIDRVDYRNPIIASY